MTFCDNITDTEISKVVAKW